MAEQEYRYWTEWSEEDGEWVGLCDGPQAGRCSLRTNPALVTVGKRRS